MRYICFSNKLTEKSLYFLAKKNNQGPFHLKVEIEKIFDKVLIGNYPRIEIKECIYSLAKDAGVNKDVVFKNIELIEKNNTFFVVSGHQLNLLLGPAFYLTKITSLIQFAKFYQSQHPEYTFIPLFWLASEDHDLKEISECCLFGNKVIIEIDEKYDYTPSGDLPPSEFLSSVKELLLRFRWNDEQQKWINFFLDIYQNSRNLTQATAAILYEIFGNDGLLILDARHPSLKKHALPLFEYEINEQFIFNTLNNFMHLNPLSEWPVNPREINLFYFHEGKRKRISLIEKEKNRFDVFFLKDKESFLKEIRHFPEKISPNVLVRPLYQQKILPCVAYVSGPSEADYWTQLIPVFNQLNIPYPLILLRPQYIFVHQATHKFLSFHNINYSQLIFEDKEKLLRLLIQHQLPEQLFINLQNHLNADLNNLMQFIKELDSSLYQFLESEKTKMKKQVLLIKEKLTRSVKKKNVETLNKFNRIYEKLFPFRMPNERMVSSLEILSKTNMQDLYLSNIELMEVLNNFNKYSYVFSIL